MASNSATAAAGLRWGRALVAALVAEAVLFIPVALVSGSTDPTALLNAIIPPTALVVFIPAGYWTARPVPRAGVRNGVLPGLIGIAFYVVLNLIASRTVANFDFASSVRPAYLLAHALKIVGGAFGGWLASRKLPAAPAD